MENCPQIEIFTKIYVQNAVLSSYKIIKSLLFKFFYIHLKYFQCCGLMPYYYQTKYFLHKNMLSFVFTMLCDKFVITLAYYAILYYYCFKIITFPPSRLCECHIYVCVCVAAQIIICTSDFDLVLTILVLILFASFVYLTICLFFQECNFCTIHFFTLSGRILG